MKRFAPLFIVLCTLAATAAAEPYWITYNGEDLPENEGWLHTPGEPPAQRWIDNGVLVIDSRADINTTDGNAAALPESIDPDTGEVFVARWRMRVLDAAPYEDPGIYIASDDQLAMGLIFGIDYVIGLYGGGGSATFAPGEFHVFELRSSDMITYEFLIDGVMAFDGESFESLSPPQVGFGDLVRGGRSLTEWDFFEFGVVPEPSSSAQLVVAITILVSLGMKGGSRRADAR